MSSLDWNNPDPWDTRYYDYLQTEYLKREMFSNPASISTFGTRGSGVGVPCMNLLSIFPVIDTTTGDVITWPEITSGDRIDALPPIQAPSSGKRRNGLESSYLGITRPQLTGYDYYALFLKYLNLCTQGVGSPWYGASSVAGGESKGIIDDSISIDGSISIPSLSGHIYGQPPYTIYDEWGDATPAHSVAPYSWPIEFFRQGKLKDIRSYGGSALKITAQSILGEKMIGTQDGPINLIKAMYALLQKMNSFFSLGFSSNPLFAYDHLGGRLTCVYRPVYYRWDRDESSYVTRYGDYKTQLEVFSLYPLFWGLYATSEFGNDGYGTYYDYKRMLQFKSIIYQMCNSTPYPFTVDFYFRAWLPYYSCPVQIVDSPPNSEYAYLVNPGLPYEMGKYKKWPDMSVTLQPHTTINKEVPFSFLLEAPTTTDKDRINRAYIPQSDGNMACVVTPDFS